jgi:hypothetical protein
MVMKADVVNLPCPKCGGKLRVTDSRPLPFWGGPSIRRKRVCQDCEHRFSTYEISLEALDNFAERLHALGRALVATTGETAARNRRSSEAPLREDIQ